jgi:hypothetical protein
MKRFAQRLLVLALAAAALSLTFAACDDEPELPDEIDVVDSLPEQWPDDFPVYPESELQSVLTSDEVGASGILAAFESEDSVDDVVTFYDDAFDEGPWVTTIDPQISDGEASFLIQHEDGSNAESSVSIGEEDGSTSIFIFLAENP